MSGTLYGVGVGPGDPELLTVKAVRVIKEADVIAVPGKVAEQSVAYQIVQGLYEQFGKLEEWKQKVFLPIEMPMIKDAFQLQKAHDLGAKQIQKVLEEGKKIAFLTLGDPCIYSTYLYIHKRIGEMGYDTAIINGIPSFCAAAARMNIGLTEKAQPLHVYPASYGMKEGLQLSGTKVLMKTGKKMEQVKNELIRQNAEAVMIENCGMADEKIYKTAEEIPDQSGYYSLIIVKEKGETI